MHLIIQPSRYRIYRVARKKCSQLWNTVAMVCMPILHHIFYHMPSNENALARGVRYSSLDCGIFRIPHAWLFWLFSTRCAEISVYRTPDKSHTEQQTAYGKYLTETLLLANGFVLVVFTSYRTRFARAVNCAFNSNKTIHVPASFGNLYYQILKNFLFNSKQIYKIVAVFSRRQC